MNLRTRFALGMAALVAVAIAATGWLLVDNAEEELVGEVDDFLEERTDFLVPTEALGSEIRGRGGAIPRGAFGRGRFSRDDALAQVVLADGTVRLLTESVLPVGDDDVALAGADSTERTVRTVSFEGTDYRILTAGLGPNDAALMVGRELDEVNAAIDGLTTRTVWSGVIGAGIAALVGWLLASRLSRPMQELTAAAEHVAATQDLDAPIDARTNDEVGRLGRSFNTMLDALDTSRRQQQRLVMDASHELRTPLTSMRTNVDLLQRARSLDEDERSEVLGDVSRELEHLSSLVAELVELATSSRRPAEPITPVDLGELATLAADRARGTFDRTVEVELDGPALVQGRRSLLERALWNLVDNAAKFSPADQPIEITVRRRRLQVRDRGPGITPEDRPHVFQRMYRSVATRDEPGTGLGLAIVADIAHAHGGTCFVDEPADGIGTIVGFEVDDLVEPSPD